MNANRLCRITSLLILLPILLNAQLARQHDPVTLKHWLAPLYYQPAPASAEENAVAPAANATGLPASALVFVAMPPCRVVDTRTIGQGLTGAFGPPSLSGGVSRTFPILSSTACTIPAVAQAYSFEITVVPPGPLAYVTAFPTGQPAPIAAITVESPQGFMASNTGIVPAGTNGSIDVYASNTTDIVIDINGYYAAVSFYNGNTAVGVAALTSVTPNGPSGIANTALGTQALQNNVSGSYNTASGAGALTNDVSGSDNTAAGAGALSANTSGSGNTATGSHALFSNTVGSGNTAEGEGALFTNTTGDENTATGYAALGGNTTGTNNTAAGWNALNLNTTGIFNAAVGDSTLASNTSGSGNTALGSGSGPQYTTGGGNISIGAAAGYYVSGGNGSNIHIGNLGHAGDANTIRIGSVTGTEGGAFYVHKYFFAAGIRGVTTGNNDAIPVVIDSNGQLGTVNSSRRFKEDIRDMDTASSGLMRLRPVTFRYQKPFADGSKPIQYGLIAEEVAEVYPDLIARSADGQIETVKYQVLDSMLLNELQKEHLQVQQQAETIQRLESRLAALEEALHSGK